jgi:hypothetical protein
LTATTPPTVTRRHWLIALALTLCCLYAPFGWLLWMDYPWNGYRLLWIRLWPLLPGFVPGTMLLHGHVPDPVEFASWGAATAGLIAALTYLGSRGPRRLVLSTAISLGIAIPSSFMAYALFRA